MTTNTENTLSNLVTASVYHLECISGYYEALLRRYDLIRKCIRFTFAIGVLVKFALLLLYAASGFETNLLLYAYLGLICIVLVLGMWDVIFNTTDYIVGLRVAISECVSLRLEISRLEYSVNNALISDTEAQDKLDTILDKLRDIELSVINVPSHPKLKQKIQKQAYSKVRFDTPVTKA